MSKIAGRCGLNVTHKAHRMEKFPWWCSGNISVIVEKK